MRAFVLAWVLATCANPSEPRLRARPPLGVHVPEPRAAVLEGTLPPSWEEGQTWMLKGWCGPFHLDDAWHLALGFPSYSFVKVLHVTPEQFELGQWEASGTREPASGATRIVVQRDPFRVLKVTQADGKTVELRGEELVDDFDDSTITFPNFYAPEGLGDGWASSRLLGVPGPETGNARTPKDWFIQERVFRTDEGVMFQFWRFYEKTQGPATLTWRRGDPYWEDSLGCTKLVRDRSGRAYRPRDRDDRGPAEPVVVDAPAFEYPEQPKVPMYVIPPSDPPFPPRWEVGMRWMTRTWCTGPKKVLDPAPVLAGPRPPVLPERPVYAHYRVARATDEEFILEETKRQRLKGVPSPDLRSRRVILYHRVRRQPFGVWQSWDAGRRAYEYRGGPCLNVDPGFNQCPFAMPALSLSPAEESSWVAKQTVREHPWGMEFSYVRPDGSTFRMTWRRGEPWPEAGCTKLLRDDSGAVFVPQYEDDHHWDYKRTAAYAEDLALESERLRAK